MSTEATSPARLGPARDLPGAGSRWVTLLAPAVAVALAVGYPTFAGGGFSEGSRAMFVAFAGLALILTVATAGGGSTVIKATGRAPVTIALVGIGLLSAISAAWTITSPGYALRWGLVILGYGAVVVASAQVAGRIGAHVFGLGLLALALVEAILGLHAVISHTLPDAEYLNGRWRPGGTFEYQPALALLEVSAFPVVVWLAGQGGPGGQGSRWRAVALAAAALGAVILGLSLGLSGTRLEPALGGLVAVVLIARPPRGFSRRGAVLATTLMAVAAIVASQSGLGALTPVHHVHRTHHAAARAASHRAARRHGRNHGGNQGGRVLGKASGKAAPPGSDFLHGRAHEWSAAIQTWQDRPLLGAGAGSYLAASINHQGASISMFAHDLPLEAAAELGVLGFLLVLALYGGGIRALLAARANPAALALLGPLCAFFLVSNLLDWTWHLAGMGAIWAAGTGALLAATPRRSRAAAPGD